MVQPRSSRRLFVYKFLAAAYTLLLGFVLPFICWGALADPSHPHRAAHLVFLMPPLRVDAAPTIAADEASRHQEQAGQPRASRHRFDLHQANQHTAAPDSSDAQPVGRSVPVQLVSAITIVSPLFVAQVLLLFSPILVFSVLARTTVAHLFDPSVVTPPPRRLNLWTPLP